MFLFLTLLLHLATLVVHAQRPILTPTDGNILPTGSPTTIYNLDPTTPLPHHSLIGM